MKTALIFIGGVVAGVLGVLVYLAVGDDTNHNGYELADRGGAR